MATGSQLLSAVQPYMVAANKVNSASLYDSQNGTLSVDIYKIPGTNPEVLVFTSSAAVDCDGIQTTNCCCSNCPNPTTCQAQSCTCTDNEMQDTTSFTLADGVTPLTADQVPWYVLPLDPLDTGAINPIFSYRSHGIDGGQVGAVINSNGTMQYGILGDENGDQQSIGEVSYAMASALGIDPNPSTGGADSGITYIIFTGTGNRASPIESTSSAQSIGQSAAQLMLSQIGTGGGGGGGAGYNCISGNCQYVSSNATYSTQTACQSVCQATGGGGTAKCSRTCASDEICLASVGFDCTKRQYLVLGGGALFLLLLLKR